MQIMILKKSLLKTLFVNVFAVAIELLIAILVKAHLSSIKTIFDWAYATELAALAKIFSEFNENNFLNITDPKILVEF